MKLPKKSLGQNFLIEKNIVRKIVGLVNINGKNLIEIGPGKGALTDEILKLKPKSLTLIEKDYDLTKYLHSKYFLAKKLKIINADILKFDFDKINEDKLIIIGNLPYNISSQILVKLLKNKELKHKFKDLIFMFQKELGERIIGEFPSKHYGRLSIISNYSLHIVKKFMVSANCFFQNQKLNQWLFILKFVKKILIRYKIFQV